jgi:hypothetical protein
LQTTLKVAIEGSAFLFTSTDLLCPIMKFQISNVTLLKILGIVAAIALPASAFHASPSFPTTTSRLRISLVGTNAAASFDNTVEASSFSSAEETIIESTIPEESSKKSSRVSILVCPAQFCVPDDYNVLFENLSKFEDDNNNNNLREIGSCRVAPLPRTEWIKVAQQLPTKNFLDATLPVHSTLGWYFDALEKSLADIFAEEGPEANVCIIGHSIGGWVARAYLGGLSR